MEPPPPRFQIDLKWVIIGIIAIILLIGLLIIALFKIYIIWRERKEYAQFITEAKAAAEKEGVSIIYSVYI